MDLFIGIVIGVALMGVAFLLVKFIRGIKAESQDEQRDRGAATHSLSERATRRKKFDELQEKSWSVSSRDEYASLKSEIEIQRSKLDAEDYDQLIRRVTSSIASLDEKEAEKAKIEPKLAKFRLLKSVIDKEMLFTELHRIYLSDGEAVISDDELDEFGEDDDVEWYHKTYDTLLIDHFRELLLIARQGTVADYTKVLNLWEELSNFYSQENEDRDEFVANHLANDWNEMIVRFKREVTWDEDLMGLDDLDDSGYRVIINKAREERDFLSLRLSLLMEEEGDGNFTDAIVENVMEEFRSELEVQYLAAGFKPGEQERRA